MSGMRDPSQVRLHRTLIQHVLALRSWNQHRRLHGVRPPSRRIGAHPTVTRARGLPPPRLPLPSNTTDVRICTPGRLGPIPTAARSTVVTRRRSNPERSPRVRSTTTVTANVSAPEPAVGASPEDLPRLLPGHD